VLAAVPGPLVPMIYESYIIKFHESYNMIQYDTRAAGRAPMRGLARPSAAPGQTRPVCGFGVSGSASLCVA
jgi:hypothetical protein